MHLRLNIASALNQAINNDLLMRTHGGVHAVDLGLGISLDPGGNVPPGTHVSGLVVPELLLALVLVLFDLGLRLLLGLLQTSVLALSGLGDLLGRALLRRQ